MQHIYQKHGHKINESRNLTCFHGCDVVIYQAQLFIIFMVIRQLEHGVKEGGEEEICIVRRHSLRQGRRVLVELLCIADLVFCLSLCFEELLCHYRSNSIYATYVFLYNNDYVPGLKISGDTPCLTITKESKPSPTVIHALSYLLASTVGNHLASLESNNKNITSCSLTNSYKVSRL